MYLYNKNGDNIEVYDMIPENGKIKTFKAQELINFENQKQELLYRLKTNNIDETKFIFGTIKKGINVDYSDIVYRNGYRNWSELIPERLFHQCILTKYLKGEYKKRKVAKILNNDKTVRNYFMELEKCSCDKKQCHLNCLLNLPESLYYLQLLELGNYKELMQANGKLLDKITSLYNAEFMAKYDIGELQALYYQGLGKNPQPIIQNAEYNKEVLQRVRTAKK